MIWQCYEEANLDWPYICRFSNQILLLESATCQQNICSIIHCIGQATSDQFSIMIVTFVVWFWMIFHLEEFGGIFQPLTLFVFFTSIFHFWWWNLTTTHLSANSLLSDISSSMKQCQLGWDGSGLSPVASLPCGEWCGPYAITVGSYAGQSASGIGNRQFPIAGSDITRHTGTGYLYLVSRLVPCHSGLMIGGVLAAVPCTTEDAFIAGEALCSCSGYIFPFLDGSLEDMVGIPVSLRDASFIKT